MKRSILVGALALIVAVIYLVRGVRATESPATSPHAAGERHVAAVPASAMIPRARPVVPTRTAVAHSGDDGLEVRSESPSPEVVRDHLETSFGAERVAASPSRAYDVEQGVRAALGGGSSVRSVECRGTLCRIETAHPNIDEFRDFIRRAFQTPDSAIANAPVFAGPLGNLTPGQPVVAVAYLANAGTTLPMPPQTMP